MSLILNLETSTKNCSVSISKNGTNLVFVEENSKQYLHSEKLHIFIKYAIEIANISINDLKSICVSSGPGSYSSLRIGVVAAKGLCFSLGIPLLSLDSLTILVQKINIKNVKEKNNILLIPIIYAKKDFFYTALFNVFKKIIVFPSIKNENIIINEIKYRYHHKYKVYIIRNFNHYCNIKKLKTEKNFFSNLSALDMSYISYIKFCEKKFHKINKFTPTYF
ncbi:tRNA (adenosine(37)-N6)-threonylcarbamoyltransferase complex dimerization subunit type 1 TsaB [Blattabacterium cuenoti]|uniref:tRNA (adenosine(37)-N6)-threonylcarbamoyltransferase complex dimerization subunit type 1 TsaB n=1 Tax=Blattabacterium cuenoti TaxID=1653831 RepID=UPI00163BCBE2|nr:tRNA (adenosine(37)-N6)-threonylcarbamoyltransferase complex dimerization subunit type 1 TsaB [Blattabacterium cuenoti]